MTGFIKYPSLINHTAEKDIQWWIDNYPDLHKEIFVIREKFDGANVQILLMPDGSMKIGRRTDWLLEGEKFYDVHSALPAVESLINYFKWFAASSQKPVRLYFELHGKAINKRVWYSDGLDLTLLDVMHGDRWESQSAIEKHLSAVTLPDVYLNIFKKTIIGLVTGITEALNASCDFTSLYAPKEDNLAEGVVIRPWTTDIINHRGEKFVIKKKAESFHENKAKFKQVEVKELSEAAIAFKGYINENRLLSVFSKHGVIQKDNQIGDYIKLVMDDAREDFYKDFPAIDRDDRTVFKLGGNMIVPLLRKHICNYS